MSERGDGIVLAVDGGNVKTDLALVHTSGRLLALVRGGRSSPHYVGTDGCVELLESLIARAFAKAQLGADQAMPAATAQIMVAGADLPEELAALRAEIEPLGWTRRLVIDNDTLALLRSGTDRGWGVGRRLRRRHQLRRDRARRSRDAVPITRRDHRRLGWRLRRRSCRLDGRGPERRRTRSADDSRVGGPRLFRARSSHSTSRARCICASLKASDLRTLRGSCSPPPTPIRSPPGSSAG